MTTEIPADGDLLTTREVGVRLRARPETVRQWRTRGYGPPGFKIGGTVLYRRAAVEEWIKCQELAEADREVSA